MSSRCLSDTSTELLVMTLRGRAALLEAFLRQDKHPLEVSLQKALRLSCAHVLGLQGWGTSSPAAPRSRLFPGSF